MSLPTDAGAGVAWTTAAKTVVQLVGAAVSLVLVRLLTPEDFGLLGMVAVLLGFLVVLGDLGLTAALIQRQELEERHSSSVFWLMVGAGLTLAALFAASAPWVARFYGEPRLVGVVQLLALDFALSPFIAVQFALLSRRLAFRTIALCEMVAVLIAGATAVVLASFGFGVWALVLKTLISSLVQVVAVWLLSDWRPRLRFEIRALKELFRFSSNLLGNNVVGYWSSQVDDLLIGRGLGAAPLGLYSRAYTTVMTPTREVGGVLSRVMFPALAKLQHDRDELRRLYLQVLGAAALIVFPGMAMLFVLADPLTRLLFGEKWLGMVPVLRIYTVVGAFQAVGSTVNFIYKACGRTDWMFRFGLASAAVTIVAIFVGMHFGTIESVALAYALAVTVVLGYPQFAIPGRLIGLGMSVVLKALLPVAAAALVTGGVVHGLGLFTARWGTWADLFLRLAFGGVVYLTCLKLFRVPIYLELREVLRRRLLAWAGGDAESPPPAG
ncbi:MAG: MOP flippase family protein [Polyangiaceae bacterium]